MSAVYVSNKEHSDMWILFSSKRMYTKTQSHLAAYLAKELLETKQSDIRVYLL